MRRERSPVEPPPAAARSSAIGALVVAGVVLTGARRYRLVMRRTTPMRLGPLSIAIPALVAAGLAAACASNSYQPPTTEWDSTSASPAAPSGVPKGEAAGEKKKLTAAEVAGAAGSAEACQAVARDYYQGDVKRGLALVKACAARDDFLELDWLLTGPWKKDLATTEALQLMVAEVIARRGGFVEADTLACRAAGVPIYDVNSAVNDAEKLAGKLVLARGTVIGVAKEKTEAGSVQVATFAESSWADEAEEEGKAPPALDDLNTSTGRNVFARVEPGESRLIQKRQVVIALRLEGRHDSGDDPSAIGALAGVWRAAPSLHERTER